MHYLEDLPTKAHVWSIESGCPQQVSLPMKRFTLPDQDIVVKEVIVKRLSYVIYETLLIQANAIKKVCEHIVSLLDIRWTFQDKSGALSLNGLQLPQSVLSIIRPIPILFSKS